MVSVATQRPERTVAYSAGAMVSTGSAIASRVALDLLQDGATAFDAAIAATTVLMVALPMSCGLGGDIALVGHEAASGKNFHLTVLGHAPAAATVAAYRTRGYADIPRHGALSATTPAAAEGLFAFHARFATRPLAELMQPAIHCAVRGISVNEQLSRWIRNNTAVVRRDPELIGLYLAQDAPLAVGARLRQEGLGQTLQAMAQRGAALLGDADYLARLTQASDSDGGLFTTDDFRASRIVLGPAAARAFGRRTVLVTPLPTQGYLVLQNLAAYRYAAPPQQPLADHVRLHLWSEIFNQTYGQRLRGAGDPRFVPGTDRLLADDAAREAAAAVDLSRASPCGYTDYYGGDTTHFVIGDKYGNLVSGIMSLSHGFGAGLAVPGSGIVFNSRLGRSATLDPAHPNCVAPGKRPVNTIMVYLVVEDGRPVLAGGTPGGDGQVQWNSVFLARRLFDGVAVEEAIGEPRFTYVPGADKAEAALKPALLIERAFAPDTARQLESYGHRVIRKRAVQGCLRVVGRDRSGWAGADDGGEDGLTIGA